MKTINNYNDLLSILDDKKMEKIFIEYLMLTIAKNKKLTEMDNQTAIMTEDEEFKFINNLECKTLNDELADLSNPKYKNVRAKSPYPRYIKGVLDTLKHMGYSEKWVDEELKAKIEEKYIK